MVLYMKNVIHFWPNVAQFFLEWEMFQTKFVYKTTAQFLFFLICAVYENLW